MIALRPDGLHLDGLARRLWWCDDRLRREIERDAEDICIFSIEKAVLVEIVRLAAKRSADDLLTQELRAEGANAKDVRNGVGIPALRQHRDGDDAANGLTKPAFLTDRVPDSPKKVLVGNAVRCMAVAGTLDDLSSEAVDLVRRHFPELPVQCVA